MHYGGKGFPMWRRRANLNNLSVTQNILKSLKYERHDISLEDVISWKSYEGKRSLTEPPAKGCIKIQRLSYAKFLTIFSEIVLHFIVRNLSSFHRPLTINPHPPSTQVSTPSRQSQPSLLPAVLSPIAASPLRGNADTEAQMETEESYHVSRILISPQRSPLPTPDITPAPEVTPPPEDLLISPQRSPTPTPIITPAPEVTAPPEDLTLRPFLAYVSKDYDIVGGIIVILVIPIGSY